MRASQQKAKQLAALRANGWRIVTKGGPDVPEYEISLVSRYKTIVIATGSGGNLPMTQRVWDHVLRAAEQIAHVAPVW